MRPVKTAASTIVYRGPTFAIGDLWCERIRAGVIRSIWEPSEAERELLAAGGRVELDVHAEPIPPIAIHVVPADGSEPVAPHPFKVDEAMASNGMDETRTKS